LSDRTEITYKAAYSRQQKALIPVDLILPVGGIFAGLAVPFFGLGAMGMSQDPFLYCILLFIAIGSYLMLLYGKPWKKLGKMHQPKKVVVANETEPMEGLMPSIGKRKRKNFQKKVEVVHPIEDLVHLAKLLRVRLEGQDFGAYLQQNALGQLVIVWVFDCAGIPYSLSDEQYNVIAQKIQEGLADFSRSGMTDTITLDAEVRSNCEGALAQTEQLRQKTSVPEDLFILDGIDARTKDLTRSGLIAPRSLRIYATTNLSRLGYTADDLDLSEKLSAFVDNTLKTSDEANKELQEQVVMAYHQGYKRWKRLIERKLELSIRTLSIKDVWQLAWNEINPGEAPIPNNTITLTEQGLTFHHSNDKRRLASLLFQDGPPTLGKNFVYLPARKEYLGFCVMVKAPNRSWWSDDRKSQLAYGSAAINNPSALNTRILVQLSTVDPAKAQFAADWRVKSENSVQDWHRKRGTLDVSSNVMFDEAKEAATAKKKGVASIKWAWVAMISRPSYRQLDDAIASFTEHSSFTGKTILREQGYCDEMWLGSVPSLSAHKMLQKAVKGKSTFCNFERRLEDDTPFAVGVLPIMKEHHIHQKGYQLISRLKEPVYVDPCGKRPHLNYIILGEKGSGKSKFMQGIGKNFMMQRGRLLIIDGARSDGSGSFDEWTRYEPNAAYFNPNRDAYNIFDAVDRRYLTPFDPDDPESLDVWGGIKGFLISSLSELCYQGTNPEIAAKFRQMHSYFVGEFYLDAEIVRLRDTAFDGGFGSEAWQQMPTLHHYLDFLDIDNLSLKVREYVDPEILLKAKAAIYSLLQQRLGKAIARPTNVNFDDAKLIVYAMSAIREEDMLPLGIAMTGSILAQTNKTGLKGLVLEEAALNLRHPVLSLIAAEGWAQGRKRNQHCFCVSQDIEPIVKSPAGNDILKNSPVYVIGAIVSAAVDLIADKGKINQDALIQCTEASFFPKNDEFGRNFLISTKEGHLFATDYPDFRSLFMVMNEADELDLKAQMKAQYPDNKYSMIDAGAKILRSQSIHAK
jgi:hypothetical protein